MHPTDDLPWDDLRLLLSIQRAGSLNAAAKVLQVSQPTISRRLLRLEETLGEPLFERTPDGLHARPLAMELVARARAMEEHATDARLALRRHRSGVSDVRVALPEQLAIEIVAPALVSLHERHPEIRVELLGSTTQSDLARREADIALRLVRPEVGALQIQSVGRLTRRLRQRDVPGVTREPALGVRRLGG